MTSESREPNGNPAADSSSGGNTAGKQRSLTSAWAAVKSIAAETSVLLKLIVDLAKTELRASAKALGAGIAMSLVAIGLILLACVFLLIGLAYALSALGLPTWAGFLIVGGIVILAVVILGLLAKRQFSKVSLPDRTLAVLTDLTGSTEAGQQ